MPEARLAVGGAGRGKLDASTGMMALDLGQPGWVAGKAVGSWWFSTALVQPPGSAVGFGWGLGSCKTCSKCA